jgi:hypothetical protein
VDAVEVWKKIPGHSNYSVSTLGRVRRDAPGMGATAGRILRPTVTTTSPYPFVRLHENNVSTPCQVHKLVIETFVGPLPFDGAQVNHRDANKENPALANLEYVSPQGNMDHAVALGLTCKGEANGASVLNRGDVVKIRAAVASGRTQADVARQFGICQAQISHIVTRKQWAHV